MSELPANLFPHPLVTDPTNGSLALSHGAVQTTGANPFLDDVLCFVYLGTKKEIFTIKNLIEEKLPHLLITLYPNHYIGGWEIVISAAQANKGFAIKSLLGHIEQHHNLLIKETTAFGDSSNDLEMLRSVTTPIAVANATTEIKAPCPRNHWASQRRSRTQLHRSITYLGTVFLTSTSFLGLIPQANPDIILNLTNSGALSPIYKAFIVSDNTIKECNQNCGTILFSGSAHHDDLSSLFSLKKQAFGAESLTFY